jgi:Na+-translocating ferredoxin:NAD+ oxidoreductase RnfG subunit
MRRSWPTVLAACLLAAAASSTLLAEAKTPTQTYLEYHDAVAKAKTLDEVMPYLSAMYRAMLESRPKEDRPKWLGNLRDGDAVTALKVTKETVDGDKCTLEATGTSAHGNAVHGKIALVKEYGAWKIDSTAWAT